MPYDNIITNVQKHISLTHEQRDYFTSILGERQVQKKEHLLLEGQTCRYFHYVDAGALRAYYADKNGKESTIMFALSDWWVTDMSCFISGEPAMLNIVAMEDTSIIQLKKEDMDALLVRFPAFEKFFRIIFQNAYIREQVRVVQNLSLTAEERYLRFIDKYPQIASRVPQKQIASYLGISPEFLSVIRKGRTGKKIS